MPKFYVFLFEKSIEPVEFYFDTFKSVYSKDMTCMRTGRMIGTSTNVKNDWMLNSFYFLLIPWFQRFQDQVQNWKFVCVIFLLNVYNILHTYAIPINLEIILWIFLKFEFMDVENESVKSRNVQFPVFSFLIVFDNL